MNYIQQHHRNTIQIIPFPKNAIEKGMVVKLRYRAESRKKILKEYIILVLNKNFKGKLHALSLEHVKEKTFIDLAEDVGIVYAKNIIRYKKLNIPKLLMGRSSRRFYHQKLKKHMDTKYNDSYRTFTVNNIASLYLIDYDFGLDINPEYKL